ncbi:MAG: hypothetical protein LAO05_04655 [Acidobacteriia bacterium]|nr:hypothetical protein [Terriglobia bacterium]
MNAASVIDDRNREVRLAARDWRAAGVVDDHAVARIDRLYPDGRVRFGPALRLLLFAFTLVAICASFGLAALAVDSGAILLVLGAALWAVTEFLTAGFRLTGSGADEAASLASVLSLTAGIGWVVTRHAVLTGSMLPVVVGLALLALSACAAWRWGSPAFGALAVLGLAVALSQAPAARLLSLIAACVLIPLTAVLGSNPVLAPSQRGAAAAATAALAALACFAANLWSYDLRTIEALGGSADGRPMIPRALSVALTALLPLAALAAGVLRRDRLWLWLGTGMAAVSAITVRHYVHIAPLWALLAAGGAALSALALLLQRWLDSGPSGERSGITARPLFESRLRQPAEIVAALATLAPAAQSLPPESGFKAGGGEFGGGGASDSF